MKQYVASGPYAANPALRHAASQQQIRAPRRSRRSLAPGTDGRVGWGAIPGRMLLRANICMWSWFPAAGAAPMPSLTQGTCGCASLRRCAAPGNLPHRPRPSGCSGRRATVTGVCAARMHIFVFLPPPRNCSSQSLIAIQTKHKRSHPRSYICHPVLI